MFHSTGLANYKIFEEPIGLVQMSKTDAATIFAALKDVLLHCILPVRAEDNHMTEHQLCLVELPVALKRINLLLFICIVV